MDARKTRNIINIAQCTQWFSLCALWLKKEILACARMTAMGNPNMTFRTLCAFSLRTPMFVIY